MKHILISSLLLIGCGDAFTSTDPSTTVSSSSAGGSLGAPASSSTSAASSVSSSGSGGGPGGSGGAATASSSSVASSSTITSSVSSSSSCMPTKTCDSEGVKCGKLDDGCGNLLDCGQFRRNMICDYTSIYNCDCTDPAHGFAFGCNDMGNVVNASEESLPPYPDCMFFQIDMFAPKEWCCAENVVP